MIVICFLSYADRKHIIGPIICLCIILTSNYNFVISVITLSRKYFHYVTLFIMYKIQ